MKSKGFTMIELLGIITILAVILLVSFPTLINVTRRDKERQYNDLINTLCKAGETYIYDNQDIYTEIGTVGNITFVDIDELKDAGLIDKNQKNPRTGNNLVGNIKYTVESDKSLKCYYDENMPISNMLVENSSDQSKFLNTGIYSSKISKFSIHNDGINISEGYQSIDCSYGQDESVMCYWKEDSKNTGYYEMNIAASGTIYTPYNSSQLFYFLGKTDNVNDIKIDKLNFTGLNTKYTVNMALMLCNVSANEMDLGNQFITKNVTNMNSMFNSSNIEILDLGDKFDTSNVTSMKQMFYENYRLTTLNLGDKFDTSNVTDFAAMFYDLILLEALDLGDKFDTSNGTNFGDMFFRLRSIQTLNLGQKFDTSNATDMSHMFFNLASIQTLNLGDKFVIPSTADKLWIFNGCGENGILTEVIVPSQTVKDGILNLNSDDVPDFWKENNGEIIKVQS